MKKFLYFTVIILFQQFTIAQTTQKEISQIWGEEQPIYQNNFPHIQVVKGDDGKYFAILEPIDTQPKKLSSSSVLVKYDHALQVQHKVGLTEKLSIGSSDFKYFLSFREKSYLFFAFNSFGNGDKGVYAQEVHADKLTLLEQPINLTDLLATNLAKNHPHSSYLDNDAFRFQFSPDKTKLLIIHQLFDIEGFIRGYDFLLVNEKLEILGNLSFPITNALQEQGLYLPQVEDSGNFHFLAGPQNSPEKETMGENNNDYLLVSYTLETNAAHITSLGLHAKMLSQIGLTLDPTRAIYISGFYRKNAENQNSPGLFFLRINPNDHSVETRKNILLSQINVTTSEHQGSKETDNILSFLGETPPVHVKDLLVMEDGNLVLVGETYEQKISMLQANRPISGRTQAVFGNILALGLSPEGNLRWSQVVGKKQLVGEKDFNLASFSMWQADNNLFVLFNDHKKNVALNKENKIHPFHSLINKKDHTLSLVSFDNSGSPLKSQIELYPKEKESSKADFSVLPRENKLIILDKKKKSIRLISLITSPTTPQQLENPTVAQDTLKSFQ